MIRRWMVFISACVAQFLALGMAFSLGVFLDDFMAVFNAPRSTASLVQTTANTISALTAIMYGELSKRFGTARVATVGALMVAFGLSISYLANSLYLLVVSIGCITATGTMSILILSASAVGQNFTGKVTVILLSIINVCSGIGGMVFPYLVSFLRESFDLKGILLIIGGLELNILPCTLLWSNTTDKRVELTGTREIIINTIDKLGASYGANDTRRQTIEVDPYEIYKAKKQTTLCERVKKLKSNAPFVIFTFGSSISFTTMLVVLVFIVDEFLDSGHTVEDGNLGLLVFNCAGVLGRLVPGLLLQLPFMKPMMVPALATAVNVVIVICFSIAKSLSLKVVTAGALGVPFGMALTCLSVSVLEIVGPELLGNAMGVVYFVNGLLNIPISLLGGFIRDMVGSYFIFYIALAGMDIVGLILILVASYYNDRRIRKIRRMSTVISVTRM